MTSYFTPQSVTRHTLIRADQFNDLQQRIADGFDMLPDLGAFTAGNLQSAQVAGGSTADNLNLTPLAGALAAYSTNQFFGFTALLDNTGSMSVNISGLGAVALKRFNGDDMVATDIKAGQFCIIGYNGAHFRMASIHGAVEANAATSAMEARASANTAQGYAVVAGINANSAINAATSITGTLTFSGGKVGIGMVPANILDITQNQNGKSVMSMLNNNGGSGAVLGAEFSNGTHFGYLYMHGVGATTAGADRADGFRLGTNGVGGLSFDIPSDAFYWWVNGVKTATHGSNAVSYPGLSLNFDTGGGSDITLTGFGHEMHLNPFSLTTVERGSGADIQVIANSVGVVLPKGGNAWSAISDEREKTDLVPISDAVTKVSTLRSVTGRLIADEDGVSRSFLIAQDVLAVLPEAVKERDGRLLLSYTDVIPLLVAAIKEVTVRLNNGGL
jgi:hypothetical protein